MPSRSDDFRYVYSNSFGLVFSGGEATIKFGFVEDPTSPTDSVREEVAVVLTHVSLKVLAFSLTKTIEAYEASNKVTIPLEKSKIEELERTIEAGRKRKGS